MLGKIRTAIGGLFLTTIAFIAPAAAQPRLFSEDSEIQLLIEAPFTDLVRAAPRSTDPFAGGVTWSGEGGDNTRYDLQIAPRGISRRTRGICSFPPLRLDFDQSAMRGTVWRGQNQLKLVTMCRSGGNYEQMIVLEMLAYRMFNEITPMSFDVRPARVTYRDANGRRREETQFNFLIEDVSDMARRNEGRNVEVLPNEVTSSQLNAAAAARVTMFQYMIGNLDWDMTEGVPGEECCHNGKLIGASAEARNDLIPVPYDFDMTGFVDPPYALLPAEVRVANLRQRVYRGLCRHNDQVPATIAHFQARREAVLAVIDGETRLMESRRRTARQFIEGFYAVISDPERVENAIIRRCRG
jgi:hypothetical protein